MTYTSIFKITFLGIFVLCLCGAQNAPAQTYQLVWQDKFNGTGVPDASKWGYEIGGNVRNSELQYYTNSLSTVRQNAGNLKITVNEENVGGKCGETQWQWDLPYLKDHRIRINIK